MNNNDVYTNYQEDEIDLAELIATIIKNKKYLFVITLFITLLATIYVFVKQPIYEIEANVKLGNYGNVKKQYFLNSSDVKVYIENSFEDFKKHKKFKNSVSVMKKNKSMLILKIQEYSNKAAIEKLNSIISKIQEKEDKYISTLKKNTIEKIEILNKQKDEIVSELKELKQKIQTVKDPTLYDSISQTIQSNKKSLLSIELQIINLKSIISKDNIENTHVVGSISQDDKPVKPKKTLIIVVAFITGFIFSIFYIFFREFIKDIKTKLKEQTTN